MTDPCRSLPPVSLQEWSLCGALLRCSPSLGPGSNLTTDAQLAAYALEFGGTVHSSDADVGRFSGIRWVNPLV